MSHEASLSLREFLFEVESEFEKFSNSESPILKHLSRSGYWKDSC